MTLASNIGRYTCNLSYDELTFMVDTAKTTTEISDANAPDWNRTSAPATGSKRLNAAIARLPFALIRSSKPSKIILLSSMCI